MARATATGEAGKEEDGDGDGDSDGLGDLDEDGARAELARLRKALKDAGLREASRVRRKMAKIEAALRVVERNLQAGLAPWFVYSAVPPGEARRSCTYQVVHFSVILRDGPSMQATVLGALYWGVRVSGYLHLVEGDPWIKLSEQRLPAPSGSPPVEIAAADSIWVLADASGLPDLGLGELLREIEEDCGEDAWMKVERAKRVQVSRGKAVVSSSPSGDEVLRFQKQSFDGLWLDNAGRIMATIRNDAMLWGDQMQLVTRLERASPGCMVTEMPAGLGGLHAELAGDSLLWGDGDAWRRAGGGRGSRGVWDARAKAPPTSAASASSRPPAATQSLAEGRPVTVLLARHGERLDDAWCELSGRPWTPTAERPWDPPLTPKGRLQAAALAQQAAHHLETLGLPPLTRVYSSPFERCFETAAVVAQASGIPSICVEPSLSEGLGEDFFRSWGVPGADGTWGGPPGCGRGTRVNREDVRREAKMPAWRLVPLERLKTCSASSITPVDAEYRPERRLEDMLLQTWGRFESERQLELRMSHFLERVSGLHPGETVLLVSHAGPLQALLRTAVPSAPAVQIGYCALSLLTWQPGKLGSAAVLPKVAPEAPPLLEDMRLEDMAQAGTSGPPGALDALGVPASEEALRRRRAEWGARVEGLFRWADEDGDGFLHLAEASRLVAAGFGIKLPHQAFVSLLEVARGPAAEAAELTEEDVQRGLSKEELLRLYVEPAARYRSQPLLELRRDHTAVFPGGGRGPPCCSHCGCHAVEGKAGSGILAGLRFCLPCCAS